MFYVNQRWLGGMLTNFTTIQQRLRHLADLEARRDRGEFAALTKREALGIEEEIAKLNRILVASRTCAACLTPSSSWIRARSAWPC